MLKAKKIKVKALRVNQFVWDFGNIKKDLSPKTIEVDQQFWTNYVSIRKAYEILHAELEKIVENK